MPGNPRREESGKGRPYTRLSKAGNAAIRKALYFPAMTAMRHNPPLKAFAERLTERGSTATDCRSGDAQAVALCVWCTQTSTAF
ncbi:MAG: IS110 family transposase [Ardenticatenales bacterium]|nr:IS110 family transposase [Ardenticatenales bacterium]